MRAAKALAIVFPAFTGLAALTLGLSACAGDASASSATTPISTETTVALETAVYQAAANALTLSGRSVRIIANNQDAVLATAKAQVELDDLHVVILGAACSGLATAAGGGSITANNCNVITSGSKSPCLYSRDAISVSGGIYEAMRAETAVVESGGSMTVTNAALSSKHKAGAVRLTRAGDGGAAAGAAAGSGGAAAGDGGTAAFTMSGGSIVYADRGPVFHVIGCTGVIEVSGVKMMALSDTVLRAEAGEVGAPVNGAGDTAPAMNIPAHAVLKADRQNLVGEITADSLSVVEITLGDGSSLEGSIDPKDKAKEIDLTLAAGSNWLVKADSHLSGLSLAAGIDGETITEITGNGHTVYYDPGAPLSSALADKTYHLKGGGYLKPAGR